MTSYFLVARIDHWPKNIFLVFGHVVAIALLDLELDFPLAKTAVLSLIPACLVASANYILNEILDAPFDREHPTKRHRPVVTGSVRISTLWILFAILLLAGFGLALLWFENSGYHVALFLFFLFALLYNVPPLRWKDRAFLDVITESFNNPIRLWLGWYALSPSLAPPPFSIALAWWCFGGLLMTGKRYAEYRFINDSEISGRYRRSFRRYTERSLVIAMVTYANLFCFCSGWSVCRYPQLHNLLLVFPLVLIATASYFRMALTERGARMEPESLLKQPILFASTILIVAASGWLLVAQRENWFAIRPLLEGVFQF